MAAIYPVSKSRSSIPDAVRRERSEMLELQQRFERLLGAFVALLAYAETKTSFVDDMGNLVTSPHVKKAHETLQAVTTLS